MQCIIYLLKFVGQNLWYIFHTVIWCVPSNKVVQVWCRADCKKSLQNYICIGRHMMAMDGLLLAAKPYLKSKVQAKGWLLVDSAHKTWWPGGITLYWHFHHVCNFDRLYENTIRVCGQCGQSHQSVLKSCPQSSSPAQLPNQNMLIMWKQLVFSWTFHFNLSQLLDLFF